jgi:trigger factor
MEITREELNPCTVKLTIKCDEQQVKQGFDKAFKQLSKNIRVPGFRPGHAPKSVVEPMIPMDRLYDAALENIINSVHKQALTEEGLEPHGVPSADVQKLNHEENSCEFTLKVPLKPIVELGEYKGLSIEKPSIEVTDEEVEQQIENMRKGKSTKQAITDRGIEEGDYAVLNIKLDGEEGEGRNFMTIAGQTFPQLDQALLGMKAEEMKSIDLTFPENFQEKDWAGKPFHCTVTIRSVTAMKLPELDASFAESYNVESVDELKQRIREGLEGYKAERLQDYLNEQLLEGLLQKSTVAVPDNMWEGVASQRVRDIQEEQGKKGKSLEQYAQENGMTAEQLVEAVKQESATHVKRAVLVQEIAAKEGMKLDNRDLNDELILMAREYEVKPEEMLNLLKKHQQIGELQHRAIFRKVTQFLNEHADAREVALA